MLIEKGDFAKSADWHMTLNQALSAVRAVDWPPGSGAFTIYPESGKKTGQGNGVKPIKEFAIKHLVDNGWIKEYPWPVGERIRPGNMDAACISPAGIVALECET